MAAPEDRPSPDENRLRDDWARVLWFVALVAAVGGVLVLGAVLRTDPPSAVSVVSVEPPEPERRVALPTADLANPLEALPLRPELLERGTPALDPAPDPIEPPPDPAPADLLADRIGSDLERLAGGGRGGWTAQLAVLCDRARVETQIERFGSSEKFHVLPVFQGDRPCFRLCWSRYDSREQALAALDLPPALRAIAQNPLPKPVSEVVE